MNLLDGVVRAPLGGVPSDTGQKIFRFGTSTTRLPKEKGIAALVHPSMLRQSVGATVSITVRPRIRFVRRVVAFELSVEGPPRNSQHFRCSRLVSIREFDGAANVFLLDFLEW